MNKTTPVFVLKYGDSVAMKNGSAFASASVHSMADITNLVNGDGNKHLSYATFEPDGWLLDGRQKLLPASSTGIGFVSNTISDVNGDFSSPILLTITLDATYTFEQLMRFSFSEISGDYCTELKIEYRNASDVLIDDQTYYPDTYEYRAELPAKPIAGVKYIRVYFYSTNRPYRHLRLLDVGFDDILFRGGEIKSATLIEEVHPFSVELLSNALDVELFSPTGDFSIVLTNGIYSGLEKNMPADIYEEINGVTNYMGRFYLETWNSKNPNTMQLSLVDGIALMGKIRFLGGYYSGSYGTRTVSQLVSAICAQAGIDYDLDSSLASIALSGALHIGDCRKALQQVLFAINAYATFSKSNVLSIKPGKLATDIVTPDFSFTSAEKSMSQNVDIKPLVTSLDLMYSSYPTNSTSSDTISIHEGNIDVGHYVLDIAPEISYNGFMSTGTATVVADWPLDGNLVTFFSFQVTVAGTFNAYRAGDYKRRSWSYVTTLPSVDDNNRVVIKDAYLVTKTNVDDLSAKIFDYLQQRYVKKIKLYGISVKPGNSVLVDTYSGKQIKGHIEKVKTNLSGGFISDVEIVGDLV